MSPEAEVAKHCEKTLALFFFSLHPDGDTRSLRGKSVLAKYAFQGCISTAALGYPQFSHSVVSDSATPWTAAHQASLYITNSQSSPKPMSIESMMPSNHLILCRPLLLLPSIPPSIRIFSNESALCIRWPKYWNFSFNINPSNEHSGLIFRMDWLDHLAVQVTLKSLLQHPSTSTHSKFLLMC